MKSYVKLYGPPILKALKALEKVAVEMPEVCIMDSPIENYFSESSPLGVSQSSSEGHAVSGVSWAQQYFKPPLHP